MFKLAPSILSADFGVLAEEVRRVESAGADLIHVDVMDGHFVPNITLGPVGVKALRRATRLPLDVHLMITDPIRYLEPFALAGADQITFHVESKSDPRECIRWLREHRLGAGLALSPDTPAERALDLIPLVDMILVMTVHPGFGGQEFIPGTLEKIPLIRREAMSARRNEAMGEFDIQVDGGINATTIQAVARAGANVFVAGSSIFARPDPAEAVREFREILRQLEHPNQSGIK